MKHIAKGIYIPIDLWQNTELSWMEKVALCEIDACVSDPLGVKMTPKVLSTSIGIPERQAKEILNSLYKRGAITIAVDEDGVQRTTPLLYKDSYALDGEKKDIIGKKPQKLTYDYDYIQEQWNTINPNLPPLSRFTPKRKKQLRISLTECGLSVESLIKAFKIISISDFLNGRNNNGWNASFDWVIRKPDNLDKVLSGNYCSSAKEKLDYQTILDGGEVGNTTVEDEIYK
jgi:hypothetical protein